MKQPVRNILLNLLLIILFSMNLVAQQSEDSKLRILISKESNDTTRINLLIKLGLNYPVSDTEQYNCMKEVYDLSRKNNYRYGLVFRNYYQALQLWRMYRYDEAIVKCKQCIDDLDSMYYKQYLAGPLSLIRFLFNSAGKQVEKFKYYTDKVDFYKIHGPIENIADCYHGIAGYYWFIADYDKAISYYMRAQEVFKTYDPSGYTNEEISIGRIYLEWGNLDKAEEYLKSALKNLNRVNGGIFYGYHSLGDLYMARHDYKKALHYYFEGKNSISEHGPYRSDALSFVSIASVYLLQNLNDSAKFYLDRADIIRHKEKLGVYYPEGPLEIDYNFYKYYISAGDDHLARKSLQAALDEAQSSGYIPLMLKYNNELHSYFLLKGDSLQALRYLVQYHDIQDSINKMNTKARIASFEIEQQQQQKENEIEQLQTQKTTQRNYYLIAGALLLLIVLAVLSRLRYKRKRDKEQLTTDFKNQLAQAETKALRAQMNPHFIFNSLNSINSFVMDQKHEIASEYLIKFSKLIRLILDNSRSETISIEKELETLKLYVLLEAGRFDDRFKCVYHIAEDIDTSSIMIPPMLLQPFVENAIWHGLMQKEGEGTITIEIKKVDEEFLNISITDDGIGREKAAELKSKSATHKSHGLKVTSQRIEMMNRLNSSGAQVNIVDLKDEQGWALGTRVELIIPV